MIVVLLSFFFLFSGSEGFLVGPRGCMVEEGLEAEAMNPEGPEGGHDKDLSERRGPFRNLVGQTDAMTVQVCVERCWIQRYDFAALQAGTRCYCSRSLDGLRRLNETACYERCSGNCAQRCGAAITMSVYDTGYEQMDSGNTNIDLQPWYLGCYHTDHLPKLCEKRTPPIISGRMTALVCAMYCASARQNIAIIALRDTCCCGQDLDRARHTDRDTSGSQCPAPCAGGDKHKCAGKRRFSVYNVEGWRNSWPSRVPKKPVSDFTKNRGWLWPQFPEKDMFEVDERPKIEEDQPSPDLLDLSGAGAGRPVEEPDNTGVVVVDEPVEEESSGSSVGLIILIVIICLGIMAAVIYVIAASQKKTDTSSEMDQAMLLLEAKSDGNKNGTKTAEEKDETRKKKKKEETETETEPETDATLGEFTTDSEDASQPLL